jgi:hypothetical protein
VLQVAEEDQRGGERDERRVDVGAALVTQAQPASGPCATPAAQSNPPADLAVIGHREPSARGVSAGLTYVMANGPMELIWTMVTPRAAA